MRFWRLVPLLFLLVLPFACSNNDSSVEPGDTSGVLKGRVVDASGENALGGVTVRIEGTDQTAVTAEDGSFEFAGLPEGDFTVVVEPGDEDSYQSNRIEVSVHEGETVTVDCTVLPDSATPGAIGIYPEAARVGVLESVQFYVSGAGGWIGIDNGGDGNLPYRPTWTIRSEHVIGVVSREGIFIGTAVGTGQIVASFSDGVSAVADIEVVADGDIARIIVHPPYMISVREGETQYLAAYAVNGAGDVASDVSFVWSVDPATLGTIEPADDLTPEERAEILSRLWYWYERNDANGDPSAGQNGHTRRGGEDSTITEPGDPDSGGGTVPWPLPPNVDPDDISLVRFTASAVLQGAAQGEIRVGVEGAGWTESVNVSVLARGTLTTLYLYPEDAFVEPGGEVYFFAHGVNEWDYPIPGLGYSWSLEPASLGTLEPAEGPWMGPDGTVRADSSDPGDPNEPMPPDGPIDGWRGGAIFRAAEEGEGIVRCVVTDSLTGATLEKTATVRVAPAPVLESIVVRPNPIEAPIGDSLFVEAIALNSWNDVAWNARIIWTYTGDAGIFVPFQGPYILGSDSLGPHGGSDDPVPPVPGDESYGRAYGYFVANNPEGTGMLTATATETAGAAISVEVPIRVIAR